MFHAGVEVSLLENHFGRNEVLTRLTLTGLKCFWALFRYVHDQDGTLCTNVTNPDLLGIKSLAFVAFYCEDDASAGEAARLLQLLFNHPSIRNQQIRSCFSTLETLSTENALNAQNWKLIRRITMLLCKAFCNFGMPKNQKLRSTFQRIDRQRGNAPYNPTCGTQSLAHKTSELESKIDRSSRGHKQQFESFHEWK